MLALRSSGTKEHGPVAEPDFIIVGAG